MQRNNILQKDKLKKLQRISRESGFKLTHQRSEIFKILINADNHPSAEEVYKRVKLKIPEISL